LPKLVVERYKNEYFSAFSRCFGVFRMLAGLGIAHEQQGGP